MSSIKLKSATVWRGGVTARSIECETDDVVLQNTGPGKDVLNIFTLASKGGGTTYVRYAYGAPDYRAHLQMMVQNDRHAALTAMSEVMHEQMVALPAHEVEVACVARSEIVEAASERRFEASGTEEAVAAIVYDGVRAIVTDIEESETPDDEEEAA